MSHLKNLNIIISVLGALSVGFGAIGSHRIQPLIPEQHFESYKTGILYWMIHVLATLVILNLDIIVDINHKKRIGVFMISGIVLFSFSLILHSTRTLWGDESIKIFAHITPFGGVLLIVSWLLTALYIKKSPIK